MIRLLIAMILIYPLPGFKYDQMKHPRVKEAYSSKQKTLDKLLQSKNLDVEKLEILIRVFKQEEKVEVWARNKPGLFVLLTQYDVCSSSGRLGPKREQGDNQVPEGFYSISRFNPESNFYLSLGIDYPNRSDRILGNRENPGGDIFIHGNCVTIGCIPITDDKIKELYILAVEAKNNGQSKIPVYIFPARLDRENMEKLKKEFRGNVSLLSFWENLKTGYDAFEQKKDVLNYSIDDKGKYLVR